MSTLSLYYFCNFHLHPVRTCRSKSSKLRCFPEIFPSSVRMGLLPVRMTMTKTCSFGCVNLLSPDGQCTHSDAAYLLQFLMNVNCVLGLGIKGLLQMHIYRKRELQIFTLENLWEVVLREKNCCVPSCPLRGSLLVWL